MKLLIFCYNVNLLTRMNRTKLETFTSVNLSGNQSNIAGTFEYLQNWKQNEVEAEQEKKNLFYINNKPL